MTFVIFSLGQATVRCDQGNVIGTNTGVYIGGLDPNFQQRRDFGAQERRAAVRYSCSFYYNDKTT